MPKVRLKGVHKVTSKGRTYYYAWRGGPPVKGEPGSREFITTLAEALETRNRPDKSRIKGLVAAYKASPAWQDLAPSTQKVWVRWLDKITDHFGDLRISAFRRPDFIDDIEAWRDQFRSTPRGADTAIQVLSRLLSYGRVSPNPCASVSKLYENDRSEIIWTEDELRALGGHASPELMWATNLAALTGLRQDDCRKLTWAEVGNHAIERKAGKSRRGKKYLIPIYGALRTLLDAIPRRSIYVLTNTRGAPWRSGLSDSFAKAARAAGVHKHFHDLRGTAATRLYLADFSQREIAEVMAWEEASVGRIIDRYVRRDAMLLERIARLDRTADERKM